MAGSADSPICPVILAGGAGTRLWPLSRSLYPKQFLPLLGDRPMLGETLGRLAGLAHGPALVVCNEEHRFLAAEQLRKAGASDARILLEPEGRNTAPAIAVAALEASAEGDDPILLVLPADHAIVDAAAFRQAAEEAAALAAEGSLVTFGVVPMSPATGYGYIRAAAGDGPRAVDAFVEKPDAATAERYLSDGGYFWNSGMFVFRASTYLEALESHAPQILAAARAAHEGRRADLDFVRLDAEAFRRSPSDSIDYAVMEKTDRARVVPLDAGWSDIGSWRAVWEYGRDAGNADAAGNVVAGDAVLEDVRNSLVHAQHRLVGAVGMEDCVIVETADAVLVAPLSRAEDVKKLVERLKADGRNEPLVHRRVYRPWGSYEGLDLGERFQVKRIVVSPGGQLSLQMHHHRAEHWVVVHGTARVTCGEKVFLLSENESTYIPLGTTHRLENPGAIPLELIEVQSGAYLGEDDIVRFEDQYGR